MLFRSGIDFDHGHYCFTNAGTWGTGVDEDDALKNAYRQIPTPVRKQTIQAMVYMLVYPVTHVNNTDGHAIYRHEDAQPTAMGRYDKEVLPYRRDGSGNYIVRIYEHKPKKGWKRLKKEMH